MSSRDPSYLAGYHAARTERLIDPPAGYTETQRMAFVEGFLVEARERRDAGIVDEIRDAAASAS